jgi:outer membrane lipoprotein carrier protein
VRNIRSKIAWLATVVVLAIAPAAHAGWTDNWDTIRQAASQLQSIEADFVQTRTLKILTRPIVSRGTLSYRRPADLRWEYASPVKSVVVMKGGNVGRYIKRNEGWVADSSAKLDAMKVVLGEINQWLSGNFSQSKTFRPELKTGDPAKVELVPVEEGLRKIISKIEITLGKDSGSVTSIDIYEGNEGKTHIEFTNAKYNQSIPDDRFGPPGQ